MDATVHSTVLAIAFAVIAVLYASVGQAGGTGYIAAIALAGLGPDVIKPTALSLNILVATIAVAQFAHAGYLTWRTCYPFAVLGVPFSALGGATNLPASVYHPVVGALLLIAAWQVFRSAEAAARHDGNSPASPPFLSALAAGALTGFVSGVTGVGGGIFLAPVILAFGWAGPRQTAAVSAVFNLMNSAAALAATYATISALPAELPWWLLAVGCGGTVGSWLGLRHFPETWLRYILSALLLVAGLRMLLA